MLLRQKKYHQNWHDHHRRRRHQRAPHGAALEHKGLQAERERELLARVEENQRAGEVIPREHEAEYGDRCQRRLGQWHNYAPPDSQAAGAVDDGRLFQLHRDGQEELAQHEDVEGRAEEGGHGQWIESVDPIDLGEE